MSLILDGAKPNQRPPCSMSRQMVRGTELRNATLTPLFPRPLPYEFEQRGKKEFCWAGTTRGVWKPAAIDWAKRRRTAMLGCARLLCAQRQSLNSNTSPAKPLHRPLTLSTISPPADNATTKGSRAGIKEAPYHSHPAM